MKLTAGVLLYRASQRDIKVLLVNNGKNWSIPKGGVIPAQDYDFLNAAGVKGIFGPGTPIPASAKTVLEQIKLAISA